MSAKKGHEPNPKGHWEIRVNEETKANDQSPADAFLPKRSKDRPCTHKKVNELDH